MDDISGYRVCGIIRIGDESGGFYTQLYFRCLLCGGVMTEEEYRGAHWANCTLSKLSEKPIVEHLPPGAFKRKEIVDYRYLAKSNTKTRKRKKSKSKAGPPPADVVCPFCHAGVSRTNWRQHIDENHKREAKARPLIACPVCGDFVLLNSYLQHLSTAHVVAQHPPKQIGRPSTSISVKNQTLHIGQLATRDPSALYRPSNQSTDSVICRLCDREVRRTHIKIHLQHCVEAMSERDMIDDDSLVFTVDNDEEFLQAIYEFRDGSREWAHNFREHGAFGSHPIIDDYSEESSAE